MDMTRNNKVVTSIGEPECIVQSSDSKIVTRKITDPRSRRRGMQINIQPPENIEVCSLVLNLQLNGYS